MLIGSNQHIKPKRGQVLLSEPMLNDPYFRRTVILLCEHNNEGSFGFVLNNYIDVSLEQIIDNMPAHESRISIGGPVKNSNLYYLHTLGERIHESVEVVPGVYMGGDFEVLKKLLSAGLVKQDEVRFFVGYSGWSPKQLEEEIQQNAWFVADISKEWIMNSCLDDLWKQVMEGFGRKGKFLANLPDDPTLN
jgi:putative transcriptional regulator